MDQAVLDAAHEHDVVVEQDKVPACGGRPKPDGESDPAGEVGWFLQREREKRGLSLEQVGEDIGIHPYHIEAIEYGDMTCMPERVEALQMISAYSDYLGFHPEPLLEHYIAIMPAPQLAPKHHPAAPAPLSSARVLAFKKNLPKLPQLNIKLPTIKFDNNGMIASIAGAFILFAGTTWMMAPGSRDTLSQKVDVVAEMPSATETMPETVTDSTSAQVKITDADVPEEPLAATDNMTVATTDDASTGDPLGAFIEEHIEKSDVVPVAVAEPAEEAVAAVAPVELAAEAVAAPAAVTPPADQVAAFDPSVSPGGQTFGDPEGRLTITAKAPVWVRIEDAQGNVVMTQMFNTGDSFHVPDRKGLVVIARDGSHLIYSIDGKERGILGKPGEILAGEELDVEKLAARG
jgi:cytoskeleton protein RodZ